MTEKFTVEDRLKVLEDIEAIKKLKAQYCYFCDARDWDGFLSLFTEDAVADFHNLGKAVGKKALEKFMKEKIANQFSYFAHLVDNHVIEVIAPGKARGRAYFLVPSTLEEVATWIQGQYNEEYVKEEGEWKFKKIICTFSFITPYEKGWVKQKGV